MDGQGRSSITTPQSYPKRKDVSFCNVSYHHFHWSILSIFNSSILNINLRIRLLVKVLWPSLNLVQCSFCIFTKKIISWHCRICGKQTDLWLQKQRKQIFASLLNSRLNPTIKGVKINGRKNDQVYSISHRSNVQENLSLRLALYFTPQIPVQIAIQIR